MSSKEFLKGPIRDEEFTICTACSDFGLDAGVLLCTTLVAVAHWPFIAIGFE